LAGPLKFKVGFVPHLKGDPVAVAAGARCCPTYSASAEERLPPRHLAILDGLQLQRPLNAQQQVELVIARLVQPPFHGIPVVDTVAVGINIIPASKILNQSNPASLTALM
jgi:hypothetical protein